MTAPTPLTRAGLRRIRAKDLVTGHTALAAGSMLVPFTGLDIAAQIAVQLRMARELCRLYGAPFNAVHARAVIEGLAGDRSQAAGPVTALRLLSLASYFAGTLPSAGMTAGFTWMLGMLLIERLERAGHIDAPAVALPLSPVALQ